jgi:Leucine-rich repeat (LRR) protein
MKPRTLLPILLAFFAGTLSAADKLDSLRKVGAKINVGKDGSVSIHFSVPKPPRGPFGEPIFDPNFRPPPPLEAAQLETLANIPKLRSLKLSGIALRPKAFETLEILTDARDLRTLDLRNVRGINDEALAHLASLANLEALNLEDCRSVTNASLTPLAKLKNLRTLSLRSTQVTDDGLAALSQARNLETLVLEFTRVSGPGLVHLEHLPKLAVLSLNPNRNTADKTQIDLSPLAEGFLALRALKVGGNNLTDAHLASVATVKNLQTLTFRTLGFTKFTDAGLAPLANLTNLRELRINGSVKVSDAGMVHLTKLNRLEKLDLGRTRISSAVVASLGKLPALKELEVVGSGFGPDGIQALRKLNPKVRVTLHRPLY